MSVCLLTTIITWYVTSCGVTAELPNEDFTTLTSWVNNLQSSLSHLQAMVVRSTNDLANERDMRVRLEKKLAQLLESFTLQQNPCVNERGKRTMLECQFHDLRQGLSNEKERRTEFVDQVAQMKGAFTHQVAELQKAVENVQSKMILHGSWSTWGSWSDCTMTCRNGQRKRTRICANPPPTNGGQECVGRDQDIDNCNNATCISPTPVLRHVRLTTGGVQSGSSDDQFNSPADVAVSLTEGRFYVADTGNHRVKIYSDEGVFIGKFGSAGKANGRFRYPSGIAVNSHEEVIIADSRNHRIVVCARDGQFKHTFGKRGSKKGQFKSPWGVAVDRSDNVYVADYGNHRVQVFERTGGFIREFGRKGSARGKFTYPYYLSVSMKTGRVYMSNNQRVSVFSSEGAFIFSFGTLGTANGQIKNPRGISIDDQGVVFLCDMGNHRVQVFHANGTFISTFGSYGSQSGQFNGPMGLAIMQNGDVILAEYINHRVQILFK